MPPAPRDCSFPATITLGRGLALSLCIILAGCQSNASLDVERTTPRLELKPRFEPDISWITETPAALVHQDIWDRIRAGFLLEDLVDSHPRIEQQRLLLASQAKSVEISSERSGPYIHYIVERLEERDMPLELALLPVIESSYDPFAYSRAHAVGLWQFIPSTGLHFNLRQTSWYDGRRDITASTDAALRYLDYLQGLFNGDWLLALAAYNAGEGTVSRAIERNQRLGLPTDYWNLSLPQETRNYVPKLLALSQLVKTPELYDIDLSPVADEPYFEVVSVKQRLDLARVAKLADLDEDELYRLNPAFTRRITLDGPKHLLVPAEKAELLSAGLAGMTDQDLVDWQQYRVRPGDTLGAIASRHQLSVQGIKDLNRLRSNQLKIGQMLTLPITDAVEPQQQLRQAVARTSAVPQSYRVKRGDSLWDIARANKVAVQDLQRWNNLSGSSLRVGQRLLVQGPASSQAQSSKNRDAATFYRVKKGDSLYLIAKRFGVQLTALQQWNPDNKALRPGQTLTLYLPR
ncbi:lytic transglycosylase domain-containing protein [Stutzerimonas tarimensis]|uniref:LysM peptidoglycan-binding domain-containing protein n=1 Tax=Stutzerimonas tarimensis TaxID=1507735 RepID=A0ABV7T2I5_9GAMM